MMAKSKKSTPSIASITGWFLIAREEPADGKLGGWYIAWVDPFSSKKRAIEFAQKHQWSKPYRAMRGQIAVQP